MNRRRRWTDVVLALTVGIGCTLEVWVRGSSFSTHMTGPRVAVFVAYMVATVALLWRRSGLSATLVLAAALAGEWLVFGSPEGFGVFALLVVAGYSVGAHEDRPRSLFGLAALAGCGAVWLLRDPATRTWSSVVGASVWLSPVLIAWLLGAYLRTRRLFVDALRDRADRAESEREILAENAVVQERARIARELHDIVAHSVSVMVVQAEAADEMLDRQRADRARIPISRIQDTGRSALTDMRRMLGVLREADSPLLAPQPGIANLDLLLAEVRESGLPVELEVSGEPTPLSPGIELSAFRIVQEALTNALKYAGPAHARVCVRYGHNLLELEVCDDGVGQTAVSTGGHGLVGMQERVALFGGALEAGRVSTGGFVVRARLPIGEPS